MAALVLTGLPASRGIAIGQARILEDGDFEVPEFQIETFHVAAEIERYRRAVFAARTELAAIAEKVHDQVAGEVREFIEAHLLMLEDAALSEGPLEYIRSRAINAEWALKLTRDNLVAAFEAMEDEYLRSRADDVDQVVSRIQHALAERPERSLDEESLRESIIVADDIPPAELTQMAHMGVLAFISEGGGPLSHASILARSLGIPYIAGIKQARQMINEGMLLIVDGERGLVLIEPDGERLKRYREKQQELKRRAQALKSLRHQPSITRDGMPIKLYANAETPADLELAVEYGAAAIGLYRSEFLFLSRAEAPSEDEQYEHYREAVGLLGGLPLTIRTLDVGSDKQLPFGQKLEEDNPALGLRGIRFSLKHPELFRTQLRAALRAAVHGPVRLMLPMLVSPSEVLKVRLLLAECVAELGDAGVEHQPRIALGGMIEVPAAAVAAPLLMDVLDFASIGTNDLIQYSLAVDRGNEWVNPWYDPLHPAILRLISWVIEAGQAAGKPVSMCGEMAGEARYTRLLLALGLTEFSMHPRVLLEVKEAIMGADLAALGAKRSVVLSAPQDALRLLQWD
jgi:phosphotransferase system enzyme I (PtsI)